MSDIKDYKKDWNDLIILGKGGQGETVKCQHKINQTIATIKKLHSQKDVERRGRMRREVAALETLSHSNIPNFIDSNAEFWKDLNYKLFISLEFIEGATLSAADSVKDSTIVEKISLLKKISETVAYCHQMGILHRDIKPDNIILRNNRLTDPVIIDFGISFNFNENDDDFRTPDGQHLGNRFIILPEQKVGETGKRDARTDVTCLVGLLYYLVAGEAPILLADKDEQKPHQRESAKIHIDSLPLHQKQILNGTFDIGFNLSIDSRWQTVKSLIEQLDIFLNSQSASIESQKELLNFIKATSSSSSYQDALLIQKLKTEADQQILGIWNKVIRDLGEGWRITSSIYGQSHKYESKGYGVNYFISNSIIGVSITMFIKIFTTGNEIVIHSLVESKHNISEELEVLREPIKGIKTWLSLDTKLKQQYLKAIAVEIRNV